MHENNDLDEIVTTYKLLDSELGRDSLTGEERLNRARILVQFQRTCADLATKPCAREWQGKRCFQHRPFLVAAKLSKRPNVMVYATFMQRPAGEQ